MSIHDMAQTIKILSESLANKIAAGEVIQRPASAVKELVENSIDANAKSITIIIKDGGKLLMQVIDDGDGMIKEDAEIAFQRHATSKILTYEDLENVLTLGFRGEALASIAAVSQVEMKTKHISSEVGTRVQIDGGNRFKISEDSYSKGTSIQINNLFYNTPGRRNFLKSNATEFKHIYEVLQRIALSHPEISIKFISDDETILNLHPSSIIDRVKEIFGEKLSQSLIVFEDETELVKMSGLMGKPEFARKGRSDQFLFLNKRFIVNRNINYAVYQAYEHLLEKGSFPVFILFLTIDPRKVDVNVHPSKMEVKFEDEGAIYRVIMSSIRKVLSKHDLFPAIDLSGKESTEDKFGIPSTPSSTNITQKDFNWRELLRPEKQSDRSSTNTAIGNVSMLGTFPTNVDGENSLYSQPLYWQIHNKYIVAQIDSGIMIVDQHAAHERVLYELAIARLATTESHSQQLLFPHAIQMTPGDATLVKQLLPFLEKLGFTLKFFGNTTVILDGVPADIKPGDENRILQEMLELYKEDEQNIKIEPREKLAKSFACKAAIKAGDPLKTDEIKKLLDQLFATQMPFSCPHGRPVILKFTISDLDSRFGRTS